MPARRLIAISLRRGVRSSVGNPSSNVQKWCPLKRLSSISNKRAFHSYINPLTLQSQDRGRHTDVGGKDGGEAPLPQQEFSFTQSLHRRLRQPRRRKGYEGNHFTLKDEQKVASPQASEGSNDHVVKPHPPRAKPKRITKETKELEEDLQHVAHHSPSVKRVHNLLRELVVHRSVKPTVLHYEALILSNCDAERGSAKAVQAVLQEMEREHIAIGPSIYEAVLKVLAVHPDPHFRSSVLESMAKQWIARTPPMEHFVIAGYIREGQLELALQTIEKMQQQKAPVGPWLYGLMIYSLCEVEDLDAVLRLLYSAEDERIEIPTYTLHHVLDRASECLHLDLTKRIWHDMVAPTYINPATGICYNVLLTAARSGDTGLAASVSKVLAHRQRKPSDLEYDLLEETYIKAGDEGGAEKVRLRRQGRSVRERKTTSGNGGHVRRVKQEQGKSDPG